MPQPIGRCCSLSELPLGLLARPAQVNDLAHPALDEPLRGDAGPSQLASGPNAPIAWRRMRGGVPPGQGAQVIGFCITALKNGFSALVARSHSVECYSGGHVQYSCQVILYYSKHAAILLT